jgi:S1-C subfamily serine protease
MDFLDVLIIVWVVFAAFAGYRRGAALQLTEYAGLFIGLLLGAFLAPIVAPLFSSPETQAIVVLGGFLLLAVVGESMGWMIGRRVWSFTRRSALRVVDAVGGSIVSVVAVLAITWFVGYSLSNGPFPTVASQVRSSAIVQRLNDVLPRPPLLLADVRQFLDRFGFPEVFADLPPLPASPVPEPPTALVRAIAAKADPSVVKVVGGACNEILSGTGFTVARHYVVTNAHVVAGESDTNVEPSNGASASATVVWFDPKTDLAVLYVPSLSTPVLHMDASEVDRGTKGAVIGHPGGGPLTALPGAVRRSLEALGRDIYGRAVVARHIYELQAVVRPGDSGGPFVLQNGEVAGIVFAASTTDPNVGYALTSASVLAKVHDALGHTAAVDTGNCAR